MTYCLGLRSWAALVPRHGGHLNHCGPPFQNPTIWSPSVSFHPLSRCWLSMFLDYIGYPKTSSQTESLSILPVSGRGLPPPLGPPTPSPLVIILRTMEKRTDLVRQILSASPAKPSVPLRSQRSYGTKPADSHLPPSHSSFHRTQSASIHQPLSLSAAASPASSTNNTGLWEPQHLLTLPCGSF